MPTENIAIRLDNNVEVINLLNKAAHGDFEAYSQLYDVYLDRIYCYVLYQVKDRDTTEEITEDVFRKAWKDIQAHKDRGNLFTSLLYRLANNYINSTRHNFQKSPDTEVKKSTISKDADLLFAITMDQQELLDSIAELPEDQAQIITLKLIEGFNNREIGIILGKSEGTVRILQLQALTSLRQKIGGGKYGTRCRIS
jgi:RNA polymerase sigma-70 factor (ECF subfamily)